MKNLIEENCKRCINYEICQSSGCEIKKQIENLEKTNDHKNKILEEIKEYINNKIEKSYESEFDDSKRTDRLFTETIVEFQCLLEIIEGGNTE